MKPTTKPIPQAGRDKLILFPKTFGLMHGFSRSRAEPMHGGGHQEAQKSDSWRNSQCAYRRADNEHAGTDNFGAFLRPKIFSLLHSVAAEPRQEMFGRRPSLARCGPRRGGGSPDGRAGCGPAPDTKVAVQARAGLGSDPTPAAAFRGSAGFTSYPARISGRETRRQLSSA